MKPIPSMEFARLRGRLLNTPLMVTEDHAESLLRALASRLGISHINGRAVASVDDLENDAPDTTASVAPDVGYARGESPDGRRPYFLEEGVAVIPVHGTIVQRHSWLNAWCGLTSTEALSWVFEKALQDREVRGVFFDHDTPGGEVRGTFDNVDKMMALKRHYGKPVHVHANELSASAGYALASVGDHISTPRTGLVGSVGVIWLHEEVSRMLEDAGVKVTIIRKGPDKANTNSFEPLSDSGRDFMQKTVDEIYDLFVSTVTRNRTALSKSAVVDTKSRLLRAAEAQNLGFTDAVMSRDEALSHILSRTG